MKFLSVSKNKRQNNIKEDFSDSIRLQDFYGLDYNKTYDQQVKQPQFFRSKLLGRTLYIEDIILFKNIPQLNLNVFWWWAEYFLKEQQIDLLYHLVQSFSSDNQKTFLAEFLRITSKQFALAQIFLKSLEYHSKSLDELLAQELRSIKSRTPNLLNESITLTELLSKVQQKLFGYLEGSADGKIYRIEKSRLIQIQMIMKNLSWNQKMNLKFGVNLGITQDTIQKVKQFYIISSDSSSDQFNTEFKALDRDQLHKVFLYFNVGLGHQYQTLIDGTYYDIAESIKVKIQAAAKEKNQIENNKKITVQKEQIAQKQEVYNVSKKNNTTNEQFVQKQEEVHREIQKQQDEQIISKKNTQSNEYIVQKQKEQKVQKKIDTIKEQVESKQEIQNIKKKKNAFIEDQKGQEEQIISKKNTLSTEYIVQKQQEQNVEKKINQTKEQVEQKQEILNIKKQNNPFIEDQKVQEEKIISKKNTQSTEYIIQKQQEQNVQKKIDTIKEQVEQKQETQNLKEKNNASIEVQKVQEEQIISKKNTLSTEYKVQKQKETKQQILNLTSFQKEIGTIQEFQQHIKEKLKEDVLLIQKCDIKVDEMYEIKIKKIKKDKQNKQQKIKNDKDDIEIIINQTQVDERLERLERLSEWQTDPLIKEENLMKKQLIGNVQKRNGKQKMFLAGGFK